MTAPTVNWVNLDIDVETETTCTKLHVEDLEPDVIRAKLVARLHTLQSGEELWRITRFEPQHCVRCNELADAILMLATGLKLGAH